jgi:DNA polymerase III epsilon subunit-like protein
MTRIVVVLDTETCSADPKTTDFVQLSSVIFVESKPETAYVFDELAKPAVPIQPGAAAVHGIREEQVAGKPPSSEVAQAWWDTVQAYKKEQEADELYLAGHNIVKFDVPIVARHQPAIQSCRMIDTLWAARRLDPSAPNHRLSSLVGERYALDTELPKRAHDGLADCWMVGLLLQFYQKNANRDLDSLATWLSVPQLMQTVPFGKYKGLPFSTLRPASLRWFTQPDMDPDVRFTALRYLNGK